MLESKFQSDLINEIHERFEGCIVLKNDEQYIQGFPDLTILYKDRWAILECKKSSNEPKRPNQEYYIEMTNDMSFARFIYPENKEEVLHELSRSFKTRRNARIPKR